MEGLGIVYLEASATGLPVVAGDSGGAPDAVLDGETGYVVPAGRPDEVAAAVTKVLVDRDLGRTLGAAGRDWAERSWTWDGRRRTLLAQLGVSS